MNRHIQGTSFLWVALLALIVIPVSGYASQRNDPDTAKYQLELFESDAKKILAYQIGDTIKIKYSAPGTTSKGRTTRLNGKLLEVEEGQIRINDTWVQLSDIQKVTFPIKGLTEQQKKSGKVGVFLEGLMLAGLAYLGSFILALYSLLAFESLTGGTGGLIILIFPLLVALTVFWAVITYLPEKMLRTKRLDTRTFLRTSKINQE